MKKICIISVCFSVFFFLLSTASADMLKEQKKHIRWLMGKYGSLSETDHPLVPRALSVFRQVMAAADKRANRPPELLMIREADDPWVMSLADGSIVLTQKGLEICYQNVDKNTGDARLAFILGHEMAHLANDDFWQWAAFETLQRSASRDTALKEIQALLARTGDSSDSALAKDIRKKKELQADAYGLLYAAMAGFDPKHIVNEKGKNFFQEWVKQISKAAVYSDADHPAPKQRAAFLLSYMKDVKKDIAVFELGVRLFQIGKEEDALDFFNTFMKKFPCREVYNNMGLIYYQKALESLAEYDKDRAYGFKLSAILDTDTRARHFRGREAAEEAFDKNIRKAVNYFEEACKKDPLYLPARVNLSSALIVKGDFHGAMKALKDVSRTEGKHPHVLNNQAIANYYIALDMGMDAAEQALQILRNILPSEDGYSNALYNTGRIFFRQGEKQEAEKYWKQYADSGIRDIYTEIIRDQLKIISAAKNSPFPEEFEIPLPIKKADFESGMDQQVKGFEMYAVETEYSSGNYYEGKDIRVLALEDVVMFAECGIKPDRDMNEFRKKYGSPQFVYPNPSGGETWVYEKFAADVKKEQIGRIIYF
ncbi:MAG: M48 family metalloprotease [Desulfococcaceae bacterium]|jgi:predicted Zn-dependent protease|nr:M48 family metalloprotease [Desulfococcaceae bacterium]